VIRSPLRSPIFSPLAGGGASGLPLLWSVNFREQVGDAADFSGVPSGVFVRASTGRIRADAGGSIAYSTTVSAENVGSLVTIGAARGLHTEGALTNLISQPRGSNVATPPWGAGAQPATLNAGAGVDGAANAAARFTANSGEYGNYYQAGNYAGKTITVGAHYKPAGTAIPYQLRWWDGGGFFAVAGTLVDGIWQVVSRTATAVLSSFQLQVADGTDQSAGTRGGTTAGARGPHLNDMIFAVESPYPPLVWHPTTHAGTRIRQTDPTESIRGGRLHMRMAFTVPRSGLRWNNRLWTVGDDYAEIDRVHLRLRVCVGGQVELFPTVLPIAAGNTIDLTFASGNGIPEASYALSTDGGATAGALVSLGVATVAQPPIRHDGAPLDFACDSSSTPALQLEAVNARWDCRGSGSSSTPGIAIYASPSGGALAAGTVGDPASLPRALALAAEHLPASPGSVRVVCRGGTYYFPELFDAPPDFDSATYNGLEIVRHPGEVPVFSAGARVTGMTDDTSGQGVYVADCDFATREIWVDGVRATLARSAQITTASWTKTANGFTAPDGTIAGYARPTDVELCGVWAWKWGVLRLASAVGTALTVQAEDWTNSQSQVGIEFNASALCWYQNARELITSNASTKGYFYRNPSTGKLYYKPRDGQTMTGGGTATVVAGKWERILSVTGTSVLPAKIRFRGITFSHTTYLHPASHGYATIQTGITGFCGTPTEQVPVKMLSAVVVRYADSDTVFSGCTWEHIGGACIAFEDGAKGCRVNNHTFSDIGAGFGWVGDVTAAARTAVPAARVEDIVFEHGVGSSSCLTYPDCADYTSGYAQMTVRHCTGTDTSACFTAGGWGWRITDPDDPAMVRTIVERCHFSGSRRVVIGSQRVSDLGEVYFVGTQQGSRASENYVTLVTGSYGAVYLDSGSGVLVEDNVLRGNIAVQPATPKAVNCIVRDNYASGITASIDPSNVVTGNQFGSANVPTTEPWLTIMAGAGR